MLDWIIRCIRLTTVAVLLHQYSILMRCVIFKNFSLIICTAGLVTTRWSTWRGFTWAVRCRQLLSSTEKPRSLTSLKSQLPSAESKYNNVKVHFSAREKIMWIGQNRPLEKFTRFLFMHLNVACMANIWRDNIYAI